MPISGSSDHLMVLKQRDNKLTAYSCLEAFSNVSTIAICMRSTCTTRHFQCETVVIHQRDKYYGSVERRTTLR